MNRQNRIIMIIQLVFFLWIIAVAGLQLKKRVDSSRRPQRHVLEKGVWITTSTYVRREQVIIVPALERHGDCIGPKKACDEIAKTIEEASRDKSK